jgi:hypothetical protein
MEQVAYSEANTTSIFKKFIVFYETKGSLLCSQEAATGLYPQPYEVSTYLFLKDPFE